MPETWVKVPLAMASVALAVAAGISAYANQWRIVDPDLTLALRPDDAVALTMRQDQRQALAPITAARAVVMAETARRALRSDPLTAPALRQIAVAEGMAGRQAAFARLLDLSHAVTRSDLGTSWLLIEAGLAKGDTAAILQPFDEALSTSLVAPDLMFPALTAALFDPALRTGMAPHVRDVSPWMPAFLRYVINSGGSEAYLADLVIRAGGLPRSPLYATLDGRILSGLAARGEFAVAAAYMQRMPGYRPGLASDIGLTQATTDSDFGPFSWSLIDREELGAQRDAQGRMQVRVAQDQRGRVAVRTLLLPAGRYRIEQKQVTPPGSVPAAAQWDISCLPAPPGGMLWTFAPVAGADGTYTAEFEVPASCPGQQIALSVGNEGGDGEAGVVISLALTRL